MFRGREVSFAPATLGMYVDVVLGDVVRGDLIDGGKLQGNHGFVGCGLVILRAGTLRGSVVLRGNAALFQQARKQQGKSNSAEELQCTNKFHSWCPLDWNGFTRSRTGRPGNRLEHQV